MNKFRNNKREGGNLRRTKDAGAGRGESRERKDEKPQSYKAKRSFSKNKSFRENKESKYKGAPKRNDGRDPRPFKKEFAGERANWREKKADGFPKTENKKFKRNLENHGDSPKRTGERPTEGFRTKKDGGDVPQRAGFREKGARPFKREDKKQEIFEDSGKKRRFTKPRKSEGESTEKRFSHQDLEEGRTFSGNVKHDGFREKKLFKKALAPQKKENPDGLIRLNKYLSNAGIASRREADNLIQSGVVKVNGVVVNQLGFKIKPGDKVTYGDAAVKSERKVYLLLNKPKDYITTVDDPQERKTVMELIRGACRERVYPVGRLDRNTTGLLLFTNDGELTTKLTHPKFGIKKVYHVSLNKGLKPEDFKVLAEGVELEDGFVKADDLAFVGEGKKEIGIEIHSGRNRIVRRLFEHLGYDVLKLDRVVFAGLTKKDLPRGKHRFLTAKEISFLHMLG